MNLSVCVGSLPSSRTFWPSLETLPASELIDRVVPALLGLLISALLWLVASRYIGTWRKERLTRLEGLETFTAVPTSSPYTNQEERARRAAEQNVQARFSVMRSVLFVVVACLVAVAATMPFLGKIPQTLLSFLIAITVAMVGIAARPFLENFIAGLVLSFSKQLSVGDTVLLDEEHYGTVEDINPTHTVVKLWDWKRYVVPNSQMLAKEIVSFSHKDSYLWTHVSFHVSPRADMSLVERLAVEAARTSKYAADFEEPQFWLRDMLPGSYVCWIAAWAEKPEDAWYLRAEIRQSLSARLRAAGIDTQLQSHEVAMPQRQPQSDQRQHRSDRRQPQSEGPALPVD